MRELRLVDAATDAWRAAADAGILAPRQVYDLDAWLAVAPAAPANVRPLGVSIPNTIDIETLVDSLARLDLVVLHFPKWTDGRAYTQARLLRVRRRFAGEIRATGDVVVDMLPQLQRTGFDAAVLRADQSQDIARRTLTLFSGYYQRDARQLAPAPGSVG